MKNGGKRLGAGRPMGSKAPHTIEAQIQRELLIKFLNPHIEEICKALVKKAKKGDVHATKELLDRAWGKASQAITGEGGDPIQITIVKYAQGN